MAGTLVSSYFTANNYNDGTGSNNLTETGSGNSFSTDRKTGSHSLSVTGSGAAKDTSVSGLTGGNADRSVTGWIKPSTASSFEYLCGLGTATNLQQYVPYLDNVAPERIGIQHYADDIAITLTDSIGNGSWKFFATTYTASSKTAEVFVGSGASVNSQGTAAHASNSNLTFGNLVVADQTLNDHANAFIGKENSFKFYNGVVDASQLAADYNVGIAYTQTINDTVGNSDTITKSITKVIHDLVAGAGRRLFFDDFNDNSIDAAKWNNWGGVQVVETSSQLQLTTTTAAAYFGIDTDNTFNLTGGYASIEVVDKGNLGLVSYEFAPIYVILDASNALFFNISGWDDTITAFKKVGGTQTGLTGMAFNATTHRFLRIRESGGTTYWEYSSDRVTWTVLHSAANPIAVTALMFEVLVGTWGAEASTTTAKVDNVEIISTTGGDTVSPIKIFLRTVNDTVTTVESLARSTSKVILNTVGNSEVVSRLRTTFLTLADSVGNSDTIHKLFGKTVNDTVTVSEVINRFKNGLSTLWSKVAKPSGSWTKSSKPPGTWTKQGKP